MKALIDPADAPGRDADAAAVRDRGEPVRPLDRVALGEQELRVVLEEAALIGAQADAAADHQRR